MNPKILRENYKGLRYLLDDPEVINAYNHFNSKICGQRHIEEFDMWLSGMSYETIGRRVYISTAMAQTDIHKTVRILEHIQQERKDIADGLIDTYDGAEEFHRELEKAAAELGKQRCVSRAFNGFVRYFGRFDRTKNYCDYLRKIDPIDICVMRNVGPRSFSILLKTKENLEKEANNDEGGADAGSACQPLFSGHSGTEGESDA